MSDAWTEEFILNAVEVGVAVAAKRAPNGVVHVFVPCRNMIQVTGSCLDPSSPFFKGVEAMAERAGTCLEFILNHMLIDHLAGCEECPKKVPPELLAMSYGAAEMRSIILNHQDEDAGKWEKRWKGYAGSILHNIPIIILSKLVYPDLKVETFLPAREAGARVVWDHAQKKEET